jgi:hypothetical protein
MSLSLQPRDKLTKESPHESESSLILETLLASHQPSSSPNHIEEDRGRTRTRERKQSSNSFLSELSGSDVSKVIQVGVEMRMNLV